MKRVLRGVVFRGLWVVPLVMALAFVGLWGRSCFGFNDVFWFTPKHRWQHRIESEAGAIWLKWNYRHVIHGPAERGFETFVTNPTDPWSGARTIRSVGDTSFAYVGYRSRPGDYGWFAFPHVHAVILCVLLAGGGIIDWRRCRHADRPGICAACGYDLRGSTGDTCPECGAPRPTEGG